MKSPLYSEEYRPQFSGHETFPLRYGWLKKAFDAVYLQDNVNGNRSIFLSEDAIARFGVGKNMVSSIRHWAVSSGIIMEKNSNNKLATTKLGQLLLGENGFDPYMEDPTTLWLIHWNLCSLPRKTTWYWAFNHFNSQFFERNNIVNGLLKLSKERGWLRVAKATIKRDVECFVRTYVRKPAGQQNRHEDTIESPLIELGLIKSTGGRDGFRFIRDSKPTLSDGVLLYSLLNYWENQPSVNTLSFESIAYGFGSPGRVFLLEENELAERLSRFDDLTQGNLRWSETAGLKQLIRKNDQLSIDVFGHLYTEFSKQRISLVAL